MKNFNADKKYYQQMPPDGGNGAGGGDGTGHHMAGQNQNNQQNNPNGTDNGQNNASNNSSFDYNNMWQAPDGNQNNSGNDNQNAGGNQNQNAGNSGVPNAEQAFKAHMEKLDLMKGFNPAEAVQNPERFSEMMQGVVENIYRSVLVDTRNMMNTQAESLRSDWESQTETAYETREAVSQMNKELSFTKQRAFKPVADAVLNQFLQAGDTPETAIKKVSGYFAAMSQEIGSGGAGGAGNQNGFNNQNGNGNGSGNNGQGNGADTNWIDVLSGVDSKK